MKYHINKQLSNHLLGILVGASIAFPLNLHAAPGTLSQSPLFLTNKAKPNIFFMVDDSGSMDFEMATDEPELTGLSGGTGNMAFDYGGGRYWGYFYVTNASDQAYTTLGENGYTIPTQESVDALGFANFMTGAWRARSHVYNKMYYNPKETYKPWSGVDDANNTYLDAYIHATTTWNTRTDPYLSASSVVDLTASQTVSTRRPNAASEIGTDDVAFSFTYTPNRYWFWDDTDTAGGSNNDGIVDATDSKTLVEITSSNTKCSGGLNATAAVQRTGCMLRDYADEMKNFANWFTYYRRREYAAKNALADVVKNSSGVRMGIATINSNAGAAGREAMADMNSDITSGNKKNLADAIFSIQSNSGTGLLSALEKAGNYYAGAGSSSTNPFGASALALDTTVPTGATGAPEQCSQNFTVLMTDGFYTGSESGYGNADNDSSSWTGDYDPANDGTLINQSFSFDGDPYADSYSNTLADIAMHFYERDLRTSTANKVPGRCGVDENPGQHMVTYTVAFGVTGTIDKTTLPAHPNKGYAANCTATTGSAFAWTDPGTDTGKIDELIHAAYNGRGEYLNATNPTELSTSLTNTFRSITSRIGAASGVSFNTNTLNSNSKLYQARFNSTQWSGELYAYSLDAYANAAATPDWQAGSVLDARDLTTDDRVIVTYNNTTNAAVAFRWSSLEASQQNDLRVNPDGSSESTSGYPKANARLNFIRGDRSCEIGASGTCAITKELRARNSRLGDLVHSQPVYIGGPSQKWPEQAPFGVAPENYTAYKSGDTAASYAFSSSKRANTRTPVIYAGSNDGMLHAFNANTGDEIFAYIPSIVASTASGQGLHTLSEPTYSHKYYADLTPTVSQAYINTDGVSADWHTVLVGGLRGGGRGIYALNVTDPDSVIEAGSTTLKETAAKNMVMWEFTSADDPNLGNTFSQPAIVPLGTSSGVVWYVVFGNGYNADTSAGADGKAYLFVVKLEGPGVDNVWDENTDYYKIPTGVGSTANLNGLSTPALVDLDRDSIMDRAYAGDLYGNMWAFTLSGNPTGSNWASAYKSGAAPVPLFYATDGDAGAGNKQPITSKPTVSRHPTEATVTGGGSNEPNLMVYFGTGQYLTLGDLSNTNTQSFYAVWDKGTKERTVNRSTPGAATNHLVKKVFTNPTSLSRAGGTEAVDYSVSSVYGWYYDLPDTGERVETNPVIRGGLVFFNTLIPSLEPCGYGGSGWQLAVRLEDGGSDCSVFDTNGDGIIDATDACIAGNKVVGSVPQSSNFIGGGGGGDDPVIDPPVPAGCPALPADLVCAAGLHLVKTFGTQTISTAGGPITCPTKIQSCGSICGQDKSPVTQKTQQSDGSVSTTTLCLSNSLHVGRFSWRELLF